MTPESIVEVFKSGLYVTMAILSMIIIPSLLVGVVISVFQAATQINEATLSFFPKIIVIFGVMFLFGSWMTHILVEYTRGLLLDIPDLIG